MVSIIIPVYNVEQYIDRCIESCVNQTYKNIEIILAVGPCEDKSLERCEEWAAIDPRIRVLSNVSRGAGNARNYGLKAASGECVVYIDSDDYVAVNYVEKLCTPLMEDDEIDIVCCGFNYSEGDEVRSGWIPSCTGKNQTKKSIRDYVGYISWSCVWLLCYRRQWLLEHELFMFGKAHEDDAFQLMVAANVESIFLISEALYFYNIQNTTSVMHNLSNRLCFIEAMEYAISYFKKKNIFADYRMDMGNACMSGIITSSAAFDESGEFDKLAYQFLDKNFPEMKDELTKKMCEDWERYALYGLGKDGMDYLEQEEKNKIVCIIDNGIRGSRSHFCKIPVVTYEEFRTKYPNIPVVISSRKYYYEIANQLEKDGRNYHSSYKGFYK